MVSNAPRQFHALLELLSCLFAMDVVPERYDIPQAEQKSHCRSVRQ